MFRRLVSFIVHLHTLSRTYKLFHLLFTRPLKQLCSNRNGYIFFPSVRINSKINYATLECILKMLEEFNYSLYPLRITTNLYDAHPNVTDFAEDAF